MGGFQVISLRLLERRRKAALVETFGPCTDEYIRLLRFHIIELSDELERVREMLEKRDGG